MKSTQGTERIERVPKREAPSFQRDDEHVVLRLSRESLRAQPPAVLFIERAPYASNQRSFWQP